jgi:hypothetical protein
MFDYTEDMDTQQRFGRRVRVDVGFAADEFGSGAACARLVEDGRERLVRVPFSLRRMPALLGRDVAYAALTAVAGEVRRLGVAHAEFVLADERVAADVAERRPLPNALTLPYVRLRCALNHFRSAAVSSQAVPQIGELTAEARADVGLLAAA